MISFTLSAQLPSGKGQIRKTWANGRLVHYPQQRFTDWRRQAAKEVLTQVKVKDKPLRGALKMYVDYVPGDARVRDVDGMLGALGHLCEYCGLIENDGQIKNVDWESHVSRTVPHTAIILEGIVRLES